MNGRLEVKIEVVVIYKRF